MSPPASGYSIQLTSAAIDDMRCFSKYQQQQIMGGIGTQLSQQPEQETRNRKRLRPKALAEWELRVGTFRVFYDVDDEHKLVQVVAIGRKEGNRLRIGGKEYRL